MSLSLHGAALSTCTSRVRVVAAAAGADINLVVEDFAKVGTAEWAEFQPFNQMPYLVDEATGFSVFESRAIAKYIARKAGSDLVPSSDDLEAYARFEQACSVEQSNFDPAASGLAFELVFSKMHGGETDPKRVEVLKALLAKRLIGYERILAKSKYVAGDKLTIADLFHLPYGRMVVNLGVAPGLTDGSLPNVTRWWKEISTLPVWTELMA